MAHCNICNHTTVDFWEHISTQEHKQKVQDHFAQKNWRSLTND